ncbi:hypothetical protein YS110_16045 [Acidovorax sp. YS12]|nr:hypothetical protein YS110_16045 [Acidovorax sp. YS12]
MLADFPAICSNMAGWWRQPRLEARLIEISIGRGCQIDINESRQAQIADGGVGGIAQMPFPFDTPSRRNGFLEMNNFDGGCGRGCRSDGLSSVFIHHGAMTGKQTRPLNREIHCHGEIRLHQQG